MSKQKHGPGKGWTLEPTRRWFKRCDTCDQFRLWADYFEVYSGLGRWWWECERCLLATSTVYAEEEHPYLKAEDYSALTRMPSTTTSKPL